MPAPLALGGGADIIGVASNLTSPASTLDGVLAAVPDAARDLANDAFTFGARGSGVTTFGMTAAGAAAFAPARRVAPRDAGREAAEALADRELIAESADGVRTKRFTASHHPSGPPPTMPAINAAMESTPTRDMRGDEGDEGTVSSRSASTPRDGATSSSGSVSPKSRGGGGAFGGREGSAGLRRRPSNCSVGARADASGGAGGGDARGGDGDDDGGGAGTGSTGPTDSTGLRSNSSSAASSARN
jgi:hypothetical protein